MEKGARTHALALSLRARVLFYVYASERETEAQRDTHAHACVPRRHWVLCRSIGAHAHPKEGPVLLHQTTNLNYESKVRI